MNGLVLPVMLTLLSWLPCAAQGAEDPLQRVDAYLQRWHGVGRLNGVVLVARGDDVLYERGFGLANREWEIPNAPDTKFDVGSISKQFTMAMVFQLVDDGRLRLDDRLTDHIPEYRRDTGERITLDHLLRHTSGIPDYVRDWRPTAEQLEREDPRLLREHLKPDYLIREFMSGDLFFEPGSRYRYSSTNYYLLAIIIERVTGKSFEANLRERLLDPLGLTETGLLRHERVIPHLATGYVRIPWGEGRGRYEYQPNLYGTGGMYTTARDLHKWNRALEHGAVVPDALRERMSTPYMRGEGGVEYAYSMNHFSLRLQGTDAPLPYTSFSGATDGFRSDVFRFPTTGHIVVIIDNSEQYEHWQIAPGVFRILMGEPVEMPQELCATVVAREAAARGIDDAVSQYATMRAHPGRWDGWNLLENDLDEFATNYHRIGRGDQALTLRVLSTRLFPGSTAGWERLSQTYARQGDDALATEALGHAEALARQEAELLDLLDRGAYHAAVERVRAIRASGAGESLLTPSNIGPRFSRAMQGGDLEAALRIAEVWALANPSDLGPQFSLANVYKATGETEHAIECYRRVLELTPEGPAADRARSEIVALGSRP